LGSPFRFPCRARRNDRQRNPKERRPEYRHGGGRGTGGGARSMAAVHPRPQARGTRPGAEPTNPFLHGSHRPHSAGDGQPAAPADPTST